MFYSRRPKNQPIAPPAAPEAPAPAAPGVSANGFDPQKSRPVLFQQLAIRVGEENAEAMSDDFYAHIGHDPVNGVEQAYICLVGKLVDYVDALNASTSLAGLGLGTDTDEPEATPPSDFAVFRKE